MIMLNKWLNISICKWPWLNPSPHCVVKNVTKNPKAWGVNEVIQSVSNLPHWGSLSFRSSGWNSSSSLEDTGIWHFLKRESHFSLMV